MNTKRDPTPSEIAERCAEIRATWSAVERQRRLRSDMRPTVAGADGRLHDVSADDLSTHLSRGYADELKMDDTEPVPQSERVLRASCAT